MTKVPAPPTHHTAPIHHTPPTHTPPTHHTPPTQPHHGTKKFAWPELIGNLATLAAQQIAHDRPDVAVEVLPPGSYVIPGYNALRVRIFIDNQGLVAKEPVIG